METWKQIPTAPNYAVSDLGNIKRIARGKRTSVGLIRKQWEVRGYKYVTLRIGPSNKGFQVHRLVMMAFVGESDMQVNHKNGIKSDNRLENLEYLTGKDNQRHARDVLNTFQRGSKHHNAKLNEDKVQRIVQLIADGKKDSEIASLFNCTATNIYYIRKGKAWTQIARPTPSLS